jgi:hypothetical protein
MATLGEQYLRETLQQQQQRQYNQQDQAELDKAGGILLLEKSLDLVDEQKHNTDLIDDFFQKNRHIPVTTENVLDAVEKFKSLFKFMTRAKLNWVRAKAADEDSANQLERWYDGNGQTDRGLLVKDIPDQRFVNLAAILPELRGRAVTPEHIRQAVGRLATRGASLHFVTESRYKPSPARLAAEAEEAARKNAPAEPERQLWVNGRKNHAADPASYPSETPQLSAAKEEARAQVEAESIKGNTHAETDEIQRFFVMIPGTSNIDWSATKTARLNVQASQNKAREVRRFVR